MSELTNRTACRRDIRWHLLTTVSALALITGTYEAAGAETNDDHPSIWIELGGQLERQTGLGDVYTPLFIANNPDSPAFNPVSPLHYEKPPLFSEGLEGKITFQPDESDWSFSAGIRYGRSGGRKIATPGQEVVNHVHYTRAPTYYYSTFGQTVWVRGRMGTFPATIADFAPTDAEQHQTHTMVDFTAGRDVGLGLFGKNSSSSVGIGVRFAQFSSKSSVLMHARPDEQIFYHYLNQAYYQQFFPSLLFRFPGKSYHTYVATFHAQREFRGVGPSISWNASVPIAGDPNDEALTLDWGINAALLFGHQRASGHHHTSGHHIGNGAPGGYYTLDGSFDRSRRVTVPNVGGLVGMSLKFADAKISIGYRGDFFWGAMDTGVDAHQSKKTGFYGPFASISIGLGN